MGTVAYTQEIGSLLHPVQDANPSDCYVQLAYYTDLQVAQAALNNLMKNGVQAELRPFLTSGVNLVAAGYKNRNKAENALAELRIEFSDAFIVDE